MSENSQQPMPFEAFLLALTKNERIKKLVQEQVGDEAGMILSQLQNGASIEGKLAKVYDEIFDYVTNEAECVRDYLAGDDEEFESVIRIMQFDCVFFVWDSDWGKQGFYSTLEGADMYIQMNHYPNLRLQGD